MIKRQSPAYPCSRCAGEDWTFNEDKTRWICNACTDRGPVRDFETWYKAAIDGWETISRTLADFERIPIPTKKRDELIHEARRIKIEHEYRYADVLAMIASTLRLLVDGLPHGKFGIHIPEYDLEIEHEW